MNQLTSAMLMLPVQILKAVILVSATQDTLEMAELVLVRKYIFVNLNFFQTLCRKVFDSNI